MGCHALLRDLPHPGIEPLSSVAPALVDSLLLATREAQFLQTEKRLTKKHEKMFNCNETEMN